MFVYQESFKLAFKTGFCFHIFDIYIQKIFTLQATLIVIKYRVSGSNCPIIKFDLTPNQKT